MIGTPGVKRIRSLQWLALLLAGALSLFVGVKELSPEGLASLNPEHWKILFISRFPRLLSIIITGSSLAVAGLIMQSITRNRFVSPTTAGTMEWCRLGVMAAILVFPEAPALLRLAGAFIISLAGTSLFWRLSVKFKPAASFWFRLQA